MGTVNMSALAMETFWLNKSACDDAERAYYEKLSGCKVDTLATGLSSSEEMALVKKLNALETENKQLKKVTDDLKALVLSLEARVGTLEGGKPAAKATPAAAPAAEDDDDVDLFGSDDEESLSRWLPRSSVMEQCAPLDVAQSKTGSAVLTTCTVQLLKLIAQWLQ